MVRAAQPPLRPEIDISWRRSVGNGLAPDAVPDVLVDEDLARSDLVLRAARPVLDAASEQLADADIALLLTDADSRIVASVYGGSQVEHSISRLGAVLGSTMDEESVGTTALGTPVETRAPLTVNGAEHFLEMYKHLSCYGRPIVHPTTRRLEGILCMTEISSAVNPLFQSFVGRLVSDIQARLLDTSRSSHRAILGAFHLASGRRDAAVVAVGDDLLLTNTLATELLDTSDIGALKALAAAVSTSFPETMLLTSGIPVTLSGHAVPGAPGAAVVTLRASRSAHRPVPRGERLDRRSPDALFPEIVFDPGTVAAPRSLALTGEAGTGRTTGATRALYGRAARRLDVAEVITSGDAVDLPRVATQARAAGEVLVIDGLDLLADTALALVRRMLTDRIQPVIAISGPSADARPAVAAVTALCDEQAALPAIRHRTEHIGALATFFATARRPGSTCGAATVDALMAHDWPANLTEFRRVVEQAADTAAARGSAGHIELADLPERYRLSTKAATLSMRDRTERQAIIDALGHCQGNKVHAAQRLGISRSTLYARIRALGITP